jgi:hypothetical protein
MSQMDYFYSYSELLLTKRACSYPVGAYNSVGVNTVWGTA